MWNLMRPAAAVLIGSFALGACADTPRLVPIRMDGQSISGNPVLQQALETDRIVCNGESRKAGLAGVTLHGGGLSGIIAQSERDNAMREVMAGCMAQKGYSLAAENVAAQQLEHYRMNSQMAAAQGSQIVTSSTVQPAR